MKQILYERLIQYILENQDRFYRMAYSYTKHQEDALDAVQSMGKNSSITAGYEDNFAVDGKAAKEFTEKVKAAVANKGLEALADVAAFPAYVGLPDVGIVESKEDFLKIGSEALQKSCCNL